MLCSFRAEGDVVFAAFNSDSRFLVLGLESPYGIAVFNVADASLRGYLAWKDGWICESHPHALSLPPTLSLPRRPLPFPWRTSEVAFDLKTKLT